MRKSVLWFLLAGFALCAHAQPVADAAPFASEIEAFAKADRESPQKPCGMLFVGSSSIRLWDSLAADMAPYRVVNRGFGGSTIADVNRYFDRLVSPYRPAAIFFYAGENDVAGGKSPPEVVAEFERFMARKRQALGATPVYFISLKPSKSRIAQLPQQTEVNEAIRRMAAQNSDIRFVNVASAMLDEGRPRDIFLSDDLHMTQAGYRIWTAIIRPELVEAAEQIASCEASR